MVTLINKFPFQLVKGDRVPSIGGAFKIVEGVKWVHRDLMYQVNYTNGTKEMIAKIKKVAIEVIMERVK